MNRSRVTGDLASHGNIFVDIANDRVGIGTTQPTHKIDISGAVKLHDGTGFDNHITYTQNPPSIQLPTGPLANLAKTPYLGFGDRTSGGDFKIYHDYYNTHLKLSGLGGLYLSCHNGVIGIQGSNGSGSPQNSIYIPSGATAGVKLYQADTIRFETVGYGVTVLGTTETQELNVTGVSTCTGTLNSTGGIILTGNMSVASDTAKVFFGASNDLSIYHNGSHSFIDDTGTGNLKLRSNNFRVSNADESKMSATFVPSGAVELYHNNSVKLVTTNAGISVTGQGVFSSAITASTYIQGTSSNGGLKFYSDSSTSKGVVLNTDDHLVPSHDSNSDLGLTGTRWRNVYADTLYGDGSNLTGITQTAINNNADNRVITGSGTANTLNAESNLTYNGSTLAVGGSADLKLLLTASSQPFLRFQESTTNKAYIQWNSNGYLSIHNEEDGSRLRIKDTLDFSSDLSNYYTVWHAGNDGTGSGLDADTLDGVQGSSFLRSDADDTSSGVLTLSRASSDGINLKIYNTTNTGSATIEFSDNSGQGQKGRLEYHHADGSSNSAGNSFHFDSTESSTAVIISQTAGNSGFYVGTNEVWHAGNDGSGTGLDADTLDTIQASSFLRSDADDICLNRIQFKNNDTDNEDDMATSTAHLGCIEIFNDGAGNDAFMAFHSGSDYAFYLGLDADTNKLAVGGWSLGANKYAIFHENNVPTFSQLGITAANINSLGVNATTLDNIDSGSFLRSDADDETTARITFKNNDSDNEDDMATSTSFLGGLEVFNNGVGNDAFMAFHSGADYALYFGLDADSNSLSVGGWSLGANKYKIWHAGNDGSGSGLDADTLDGMQPSAVASNSTIVQRNGNGYVFANYFNTTTNDTGTAADVTRFYASEDAYIRYIDKSSMRSVMNVSARSSAFGGRETVTSDQNYWIGSMGWGNQNFDTTVWDYGSGFIDVWSNPSGQPSGTGQSHWQAIQSMHYTNAAGRYGFRIACGTGNPAHAYIQGRWNTTTNGWHKLWNAANDGSGSGLDADTCDGVHGTSFLRSDTDDALTKGSMTTYSGGWNDWLVRFQNNNSTNDYVYMAHHNYGMHVRNDSSGTGHYLFDVYSSSGNRFQIRGSDARTTLSGTYMLQTGLIHFDVKLTSGTSSGDIKFNSVLENVGSHYSTSTGRFTAPVAGVYHFAGTLLQTNSGGQFDVNLRYNGSSGTKGNSMRATFTGHSTIQISETLKMNANDYVHINVSSGSLHHDGSGAWCGFQGTLLG